MRCVLVLLIGGWLVGGCAHHRADAPAGRADRAADAGRQFLPDSKGTKPAREPARPPRSTAPARTTPEPAIRLLDRPVGKVVVVRPQARFAVVDFSPGPVPQLEQRLDVYRQGLKVGEVLVTGPIRDSNAVVDIREGEAAEGDDVRQD